MLYLIAIACPPVAVLMCGKPGQAVTNFVLCLFLLIPGWIHAFAVVANYYADKRTTRLVNAFTQPRFDTRTGRRIR